MLKEACVRLGVKNLIASDVDSCTGKFFRKNCHDIMKVIYFKEIYHKSEISEFYSDSLSDTPMAKLARKAFLIKNGQVLLWPE